MVLFKAFDNDMKHRGNQYVVGGTYTYEGCLKNSKGDFYCCDTVYTPMDTERGFFCYSNILGCLIYNSVIESRFCQVEIGEKQVSGDRVVSSQITIIKEITGIELLEMLTGKFESSDGHCEWRKHGKLHRDGDKPAYISSERQEWYVNGVHHRDDPNKPDVVIYGFGNRLFIPT